MLSRAEQIDVLRYWEEIELLTPPDYRVVENERLLVCEWKSGRPAGREAQAIAKWQKERWQEPFEYPERAPRGVVTDMMPVFMVYVGILPKRDVYRRLIDEMKALQHSLPAAAKPLHLLRKRLRRAGTKSGSPVRLKAVQICADRRS